MSTTAWLVSSLVSMSIAGFGLGSDWSHQDPDAESKCVADGCKAYVRLPGVCAAGIISITNQIGTTDGACSCPEVCTVLSNACQIQGTYQVSVLPAHAAAVDIVVGGVNFGDSFTWAPSGINGCGNSNFEIIMLTGVPGGCNFIIAHICETCMLDC
jgi:hypothetical protein